MHHRALVSAPGGGSYTWSCVCSPGDRHDHAATHAELAEKLEKREAAIGALNALVGRRGRVGLLRYEITDCNVQIHGPKLWRLYVAWTQTTVFDGEATVASRSFDYEDPALCLALDEILALIEAAVASAGDSAARGIRAAGEFLSS